MEKSANLSPEICEIYFASINDVSTITDGSDTFHKVVTFKSQKNWEKIYCSPASKEFTELQKESEAGPYYEQKVNLSYPGDDEGVREDFENYGNKRLLIKLVYHSGIEKLLGSLTNPVKSFADYTLKNGGHAVSFECKAIQKAFMLD